MNSGSAGCAGDRQMVDRDVEELIEQLLEYIEAENVIPIIGKDLLRVKYDEKEVLLYDYLARELAERLNVKKASNLNDVVGAYLETGCAREDVYSKIPQILRSAEFQPPEALLDLAQIDKFKLFIVLTFDSLLVTAIDQVRKLAGGQRTLELAYSPRGAADLPEAPTKLRRPVVYHLLGKLSAQPNEYVVTDEDMLEFLHHMQRRQAADLLFDALRDNHLLFIGCTFSDWLARFLIRSARRRPLSQRRDWLEALVSDVDHDENLVVFLRQFSTRTKIVSCPPGAFVAELSARYRERAGHEADEPPVSREGDEASWSDDMPEGAVFLSYTHEDYAAARRLRNFLDEEAGIDVWFDKEKIKGGEFWDRKIHRNVNNCSYFVPVISARATRILDGYFRKEWAWAVERASARDEDVPFIIPVAIDDTPDDTTGVPDRFTRAHWTRLPDGEGTRDFGNLMRSLARNYRRRKNRAWSR
jgi:hypothetical protein